MFCPSRGGCVAPQVSITARINQFFPSIHVQAKFLKRGPENHISKKGPLDKGQRKNIDFLEKAVRKTLT